MTTKIKAGVIGDGVVGTTQIADDAITSALIADNAVGIPALAVSDGSNGQVLTTNGSGTLSFSTVSGTTINNNADNRVITGSGTANTLEGESGLIFDGTNLGIGSASPVAPLTINDKATFSFNSSDFALGHQLYYDGGDDRWERLTGNAGSAIYQTAGNVLFYRTAAGGSTGDAVTPTESMRIDSSGNVGIGKTPNRSRKLEVAGTMNLDDGSEYEWGDGSISIGGNSSTDLMTFATASTERTRLTNNGAFKTKQGTSAYANATSNYNEICSNTGATANLLIRQGSTYYADCVNLWYYSGTPNNTQSNFLNAFDSTATRAKIFSNGGFANYQSNDSNLCDEREKKNIVAANSTWNDVKSWNIKTFHYNEDDDNDAKRYGVIAQDIEKINPDLIVDWEKQQEKEQELWQEEDKPLPEGVKVGDVKEPAKEQIMRKAVKEQQMYIMAIKALQEAMTEIESLKSRIETLEG